MSLADEYRRQNAWRSWGPVFAALGDLQGQTVLDMGCAVGEQAAALAVRGARVIGVDGNEALIAAARAREIPGASFHLADLRADPGEMLGPLLGPGARADGLWSSFVAAYFPRFDEVLAGWARALRPGARVAITEVDDLFGHEPLAEPLQEILAAYARDGLEAGRYDFHMGRKLPTFLERAGFEVEAELSLPDADLAFDGPARPEVLEGWARRLDRMGLLHSMAGEAWPTLRAGLLDALSSPRHRSRARVICCIGRLRG